MIAAFRKSLIFSLRTRIIVDDTKILVSFRPQSVSQLPYTTRNYLLLLLTGLVGSLGGLPEAAGDVIRLQQGGEIRGEFIKQGADEADGELGLITLEGICISVAAPDVEFAKTRPRIVEEYEQRARLLDGTVAGHWQLAEWCLSLKLYAQREEQLRAILELDADHADARRILGYQNYNGKWMTRDEFMMSRGYVQHQGKWMTPQERELREKTAVQRQAEGEWFGKIRLWAGWLTGSDLSRQQAALAEFRSLTAAEAAAALRTILEGHRDVRLRVINAEVLGRLEQGAGVPGLVRCLLLEDDLEVLQAARRSLRTEHYAQAIPLLLKGLQSAENRTINRAAELLGMIGDRQVVPALISVLVTTHTQRQLVPVNTAVSFASPTTGGNSYGLPSDLEMLSRAGQLPYGVQVQQGGFQRTQVVNVRVQVTNAHVLEALRKLTGKDLGYNERDWQLWWALQQS